MKIPSEILIGGHTVKIKLAPLEENGNSDFDTNTITIDSSLPQSQRESTLIHEILHFLNSTLGDSPMGHALLDSLAEQLYQVLRTNHLLK